MEMRKLGEQWIEEIDGVRHMVKLVEGKVDRAIRCSGCIFRNEYKNLCEIHGGAKHISEVGCARQRLIIKDLGPVNEDGFLPCPFCWEYPVVQPENSQAGFGCHCDKCKCAVSGLHESMQEVMDEWNRRA